MDSFKLSLLVSLIALVILLKRARRNTLPRRVRQKMCISKRSGEDLVRETLNGPSKQIFQSFRMEKESFQALCSHFRERGYLANSKHLLLEEKMMMFLLTLSHNTRMTHVSWLFQHSGETIHKYFHEVLKAMILFSKEMIVPPSWDAPVGELRSYKELREGAFKGAVGALDGTLIHAVIPPSKQTPYRGRGGKDCWQNVLAICDFDMKFIYAVAGWEGTAHDARVLTTSVRNPAFRFPLPPRDKYYLCDAAYTHTRGFMAPYRGVRYWLADYRRHGTRARTKEEKFNHSHSKLRNVIERSFGVLKARFPILSKMPGYKFPIQRNIVIACMALHNFLRRVALNDVLFQAYGNEELLVNNQIPVDPEINDGVEQVFRPQDQAYMINLRSQVADILMARPNNPE